MADPVTANSLMTALREQIDLLNEVLELCTRSATVFEIPYYVDGVVPDLIKPKVITGAEAIETAKSAYRNFSRPKDQHPGSVFRLPGVVVADKDLKKVIARVNSVKTELKQLIMSEYPNNRACLLYTSPSPRDS